MVMSDLVNDDGTYNRSGIMLEAHARARAVGRQNAKLKGFGYFLRKAWQVAKGARFNSFEDTGHMVRLFRDAQWYARSSAPTHLARPAMIAEFNQWGTN
jgi:hypothetical protein